MRNIGNKIGYVVAVAAAMVTCGGFAALKDMGEPVWKLEKPVALSETSSIKVPCTAIPDTTAFTIEAKVKFDSVDEQRTFNLFDQRTSDTGFSYKFTRFPRIGSPMGLDVNGVFYNVAWFRTNPGESHTYVISAKRGLIVCYVDGRIVKRIFAVITPNLNPIVVGGPAGGRFKTMEGVTLEELNFYGPGKEYFAKGETMEFATGFRGGKGWMIEVPSKPDPALPSLLYIGDSISVGYTRPLKALAEGRVNTYHWMTFVGDPGTRDFTNWAEVASQAKFDYIVFNNGLHSLHWTEDKVTDAQIEDITRGMVNALRKGCPGARLIWLSTTPHTERSPGSGLGDRNPIVLRINRIAEKVMKDEKIDIIDGYGLLKEHLDWTRGDGYHWNDNGYKLIAETIIDRTIGKP